MTTKLEASQVTIGMRVQCPLTGFKPVVGIRHAGAWLYLQLKERDGRVTQMQKAPGWLVTVQRNAP